MNKKKIICSVLAAQFSFNFFMGDKIVSADEVLNANPEKEITSEVDNQNKNAVIPKDTDEIISNTTEENSNNVEETDVKKSNEKIEADTEEEKLEKDTETEEYSIDKPKDDLANLETEVSSEERYYEETQTLNAANDEIIWEGSFNPGAGYYDYSKGKFMWDCTINGITFNIHIYEGSADICDFNSQKSGDLILPNKIKVNGEYYSIIGIDDYSFEDCSNLSSIVLPDSIASIGSYAFKGCSNLNSITIPDSVTSIDSYAFEDCSNLSSITIPEGVTDIMYSTFRNCSKLSSITIPDSVTSIRSSAFENCSKLSSIIIPKSVRDIENDVFLNCSNLNEISVDDNNTSYSSEDGVLFNKDKSKLIIYPACKSDTSYKVPNSVTSIGRYAFENCSNLSSITIPDSVTNIEWSAFKSCSNLSSITIPDSVTNIEFSVFENCSNLSSIILPDSLTSIDSSTFKSCSNLSSIIIPDSVTSIGRYAFEDCSNLSSITIPNSVISIGTYAFENCSKLSSITIPNSVTSMGWNTFYKCGLNSIWMSKSQYNKLSASIPERIELIESNLYNRYDYVDDVIKIKADSVKCFERLSDGSKKEIDLRKDSQGDFIHDPSKIEAGTKYYSYEAVKDGATYESPEISVQVNPSYTKDNITYLKTSDNTVSIISYKNNTNEAIIPSSVVLDGQLYKVTSIDNDAFLSCTDVEKITIPDCISKIGDIAFNNCSNLKEISVDSNNTSYTSEDGLLFNKDKSKLIAYPKDKMDTSYEVPSNIKEIYLDIFKGNSNLSNILIKDNVEKINSNSLIGCDNLTFTVTSQRLKEILINIGINENNIIGDSEYDDSKYKYISDDFIFEINKDNNTACICDYKGTAFDEIHIPNKVDVGKKSYDITAIGEKAFSNCDKLNRIYIPKSITSIAESAFVECNSLQYIGVDKDNKNYSSDDGVLFNKDKTELINHPVDCYIDTKYTGDPNCGWDPNAYTSYYDVPDSVTRIGNYAFYNNYKYIEEMNMPDSVTSIGDYAFYNCNSFDKIRIPSSVTSIGNYAFAKCYRLIGSIPNSVNSIGDYAFFDSNFRGEISIPNGIKSIGEGVFSGCSLNGITIPDSVTSIEKDAFSHCSNLKSIIIPDNIKNIDQSAFSSSAVKSLWFSSSSQCNNYKDKFDPDIKLIELNISSDTSSEESVKIKADSVSNFQVRAFEVLDNGELGTEIDMTEGNDGYFVQGLWSFDFGKKRYKYIAEIDGVTYESPIISLQIKNTAKVKGITYKLNDDNSVTVEKVDKKLSTINIPDKVMIDGKEYNVTSIGDSAFEGNENLKNVTIDCKNIRSIGSRAFYGCKNLEGIKIPNSVKNIGSYAFSECSKLDNIDLPDGLNSIEEGVFIDCSSLSDITIPNSVTSIGDYAFEFCNLTNIKLPNSITNIGKLAFFSCKNLSNIKLSNNLTSIGELAFYSCKNLNNIDLPNSLTNIGINAFACCEGLKNIQIPNSVTSIGSQAFYGCKNLINVAIPDSVIDMGNYIFLDCSSLKTICTSESQYNKFKNKFSCNLALIDSNLYINDNSNDDIIKIKADSIKAFEIFADGSEKEISMSKGDGGYFNQDISNIEDGKKYYRYEVEIDGVTYNISNISINGIVKPVNGDIIWGEDSNYTWSVEDNNKQCKINNIYFKLNDDDTTVNIFLHGSIYPEYDDPYPRLDSNLILPNKIKVEGKYYKLAAIGNFAFANHDELESITIPGTEIGNDAFSGCSSLTDVNILEGITSIGEGVFFWCKELKNINIPNSVISIGNSAFCCSGLENIDMPNSIKNIGDSVFASCKSLKNIKIPNGVTSIGESAFSSCNNLKNIKIPNSITNIGREAFRGSGLDNIIIPNSELSIGNNVFEDCPLKSVWTSEAQYNKLKDKFKHNSSLPILIESNLYVEDNSKDSAIKIKADSVKAFEIADNNIEKRIAMKQDEDGYFIQDLSKVKAGEKHYRYEAVIDGVIYKSHTITVNILK